MNPHYPEVALRAGHRCEYCYAPEAVFNLPLEVEHIVPLAPVVARTLRPTGRWPAVRAIFIRPRMSVALTPRVRPWSVSSIPAQTGGTTISMSLPRVESWWGALPSGGPQ